LAGIVCLICWHFVHTISVSLQPSIQHGRQQKKPVVPKRQSPQRMATHPTFFLVICPVLVPQNWQFIPPLLLFPSILMMVGPGLTIGGGGIIGCIIGCIIGWPYIGCTGCIIGCIIGWPYIGCPYIFVCLNWSLIIIMVYNNVLGFNHPFLLHLYSSLFLKNVILLSVLAHLTEDRRYENAMS
jgi:hypothetical protein